MFLVFQEEKSTLTISTTRKCPAFPVKWVFLPVSIKGRQWKMEEEEVVLSCPRTPVVPDLALHMGTPISSLIARENCIYRSLSLRRKRRLAWLPHLLENISPISCPSLPGSTPIPGNYVLVIVGPIPQT